MNAMKSNATGFLFYVFSLGYSFFLVSIVLNGEFLTLHKFGGRLLSETNDMILYLALHIPFYISGVYFYKVFVQAYSLKAGAVFFVILFLIPLIDAVAFHGVVFGLFAFALAFGYGVSEICAMASIYALYAIGVMVTHVIISYQVKSDS